MGGDWKKVNIFVMFFLVGVLSGKTERNINIIFLFCQFRPHARMPIGPGVQRLAHVMDALVFEVKISFWKNF